MYVHVLYVCLCIHSTVMLMGTTFGGCMSGHGCNAHVTYDVIGSQVKCQRLLKREKGCGKGKGRGGCCAFGKFNLNAVMLVAS